MHQSLASALVLLLPLVLPSAHAQTIELDQVIAIVNDEAVTLSEYQSRYQRQQLESQSRAGAVPEDIDLEILSLLVDERLQAQYGERTGIVVTETEIDDTLRTLAARNNISLAQLFDEIEKQGISVDQFRRSIREQRLIQRVVDRAVNSRVTVTEQEIDYHLQAHRELYTPDENYEVSHIFVAKSGDTDEDIARDRENVEFIYSGLQDGKSFDQFARDFSDGDNSENGGYIGWRGEDQLPDLFLDALRATPVAGITDILESPNGFHILKLHSKEGDVNIVSQQKLRHIFIQPRVRDITDEEALTLLNDLVDQLRNGADFAQLARLNSDDKSTASEGGELGWVNPGEIGPQLESAISSLPLNQVSDPIRAEFGYHLVEVLDRRKQDISLEMSRQKAESEVFRRKAAELYENWFDRLRDQAYIEYVLDS